MCTIYANQDPDSYAPITRSLRIGGAVTSLRLEAAFWTLLDELAASQGITTSRFINMLHQEVQDLRGDVTNFASLLRVSCLLYVKGQTPMLPGFAAVHKVFAA
jgi:predicted DNA-binding ribbon-helix-helix protein